eukprot:33492-Eustigmatos_ZCMA.PRE.1
MMHLMVFNVLHGAAMPVEYYTIPPYLHTGGSKHSTTCSAAVNVRLSGATRVQDEHSATRRSSNGSAGSAESHKSHDTN